ncbi:MAG: hypothetical protein AAGB19_20140, partial [Cyanobacteria bacterium P01_F01_bin.3]
EIEGLEFELQQNLGVFGESFLGLPLNWIIIGGNYVSLDAEVERSSMEMNNLSSLRFGNNLEDPDVFQEGGALSKRSLYDQPSFVANAFVTFDIEKTGTKITLSQNWLGEQLNRVGGLTSAQVGAADLYWDDFSSMSIVIEQKLGEHWKLRFSAKNINSPERRLYEDPSFYNALLDSNLYRREQTTSEEDILAPSAAGFTRSIQVVEPTYSISLSGSF